MTTREVIVLPEAQRDLDEIMAYYRREAGNEVADRFAESMLTTALSLVRFPTRGKVRETQDLELREIRWIPVRGFEQILIYYRVTPDTLDVVRMLHGNRDIDRTRFE